MTTSADIDAVVDGQTVCSQFLANLAQNADQVALRWQNEDDSWSEWTFADVADRVARFTTALEGLGVGVGDRVVMMIRNRPEFHVADLATLFCGATPVSIYNSSSAEQVQYLASHCEASVAICEDRGFLDRVLAVRGDLADLKEVVVIESAGTDDVEGLHRWDDLLESAPADLETASSRVTPESLATIIYTSGTTGPPKGVMITHYNAVWTVECLRLGFVEGIGDLEFSGLRVISYLPMAHIAERVLSHYQGMFLGYEVTCCPDPTLIASYAGAVKPNIMFGVPRVWEKIYAGVNAVLSMDPEKKEKFDEAVAAAIPISEKMAWGTATDEEIETWNFLDAVAFAQVRELVGLDQLVSAVTGAAPIPGEMLAWFRAIGVPLSEIYGMSESSGPMTWAAGKVKAGSVGPAVPGCEVALADDGEVICRGGNVFQGYLNAPDKTAEALDDDGWLHSGDIGELDDEGYFTIVDRKKELIITAGGKNISPSNLESALKMIPLVGQACAIGDQRKFVSALVVLDPDAARAFAAANGLDGDDLVGLAANAAVVAEIDAGVRDVMAGFNNAEAVKKVTVLGEEWLPDSDLLTPTSKLKRRGILARFEGEIEAMYA